ncbi:MAG: NAD(P)/FAD-dependent oxidoreductase [Myxococcota bacterium]
MDVLVIGGGPAGLTAALMLGRARRRVCVIDAGNPRHAVSSGVHNFLTRDGMAPAALRSVSWEQMAAYPSVQRVEGRVRTLVQRPEGWIAIAEDGTSWQARSVLLATGMVDEHPDIPGYTERWGEAIHFCPFCHGWEVRDRPLGLLANGPFALHMAPMLRNWSADVAIFTHGTPAAPALREWAEAQALPLYEAPIARLEGPGRSLQSVHLADGQALSRAALFVHAPQHQVPLVQDLGLACTDEGYVVVDEMQRTSLPGLWAAGDLTTRYQQVVEAAAQGGRAAGGIQMALTAHA